MTSMCFKDENLTRKIFDDLWNTLSLKDDGNIIYDNATFFDDLLPLLISNIEINNFITSQEKANIVSRCVLDQRRAGKKNFQMFVDEIIAKTNVILALPKKVFYLTTTVSFRRHSKDPSLTKQIGSSIVSICQQYPKKLESGEWFLSGFGEVKPGEPWKFARLYARTSARTEAQAAKSMLADVELMIACMNLIYSSGRRIYIGKARAMNQIRLGPFQLIHNAHGKVNKDHIWYEADYDEDADTVLLSKNFPKVKNFVDRLIAKLTRSSLKTLIEGGLRQYNAALNMKDPQLCLIRLWASLEILMKSAAGGSRITAKRASFFSTNYEYRFAKLLHVADVRNRYVHAGTDITLVDDLVEDMKVYVAGILRHMLFSKIKYHTEEDFLGVLDLPSSPKLIKRRIAIANMGLKFRE